MNYHTHDPVLHDVGGDLSLRHPHLPHHRCTRPRYQFLVTKLRSWRTGYARILVLDKDSFATLDPHHPSPQSEEEGGLPLFLPKETNRWSYTSIRAWWVPPNEKGSFVLQMENHDQLKFSATTTITTTHHESSSSHHRAAASAAAQIVSRLLQCADEAVHPLHGYHHQPQPQQHQQSTLAVFRSVQRHTRHGTIVPVALHVKPYGLIEVCEDTGETLQLYRYVDMNACSLLRSHHSLTHPVHVHHHGLVIYFHDPKTRCYSIPFSYRPHGDGKSDLLTLMRDQCAQLGVLPPLDMHDSVSDWRALRNNHGIEEAGLGREGPSQGIGRRSRSRSRHGLGWWLGSILSSWRVTKASVRHKETMLSRLLVITDQGLLIEKDDLDDDEHNRDHKKHDPIVVGSAVVSVRRLSELYAIVRHPPPESEKDYNSHQSQHESSLSFTLEFCCCRDPHGSSSSSLLCSRTYASVAVPRDALLACLLDAATNLAHNTTVHVTDFPTMRYCLSSGMMMMMMTTSASSSPYAAAKTTGGIVQFPPPRASSSPALVVSTIPLYCLKRVHAQASATYARVVGTQQPQRLALPSSATQHVVVHRSSYTLPHIAMTHPHKDSIDHKNHDDDTEQHMHARRQENIIIMNECQEVVELCRELNASVPPSASFESGGGGGGGEQYGLPTSTSDQQLLGTIGALWGLVAYLLRSAYDDDSEALVTSSMSRRHNMTMMAPPHRAEAICAALLQTLHRLSQTPAGYTNSVELSTLKDALPCLWIIQDPFCKFSMLQVLKVLLSGGQGFANRNIHKRDLEVELVNKSVIVNGPTFIEGLVSCLVESSSCHHSMEKKEGDGMGGSVSDLVLLVASDILQGILCSYYETTTPETYATFVTALTQKHWALLRTLQSSTPLVVENTALLLHMLSFRSSSTFLAIRDDALSSAAILQHFHSAIFSPVEGQRYISRYLCSLWFAGPVDSAEKRLLRRMVPSGFFTYLNMPQLSPEEETQLDEIEIDAFDESVQSSHQNPSLKEEEDATFPSSSRSTSTARLRKVISALIAAGSKLPSTQPVCNENFRIFFHVLTQDHSLADLIWSQQTRMELRIALESEIQYVKSETQGRGVDAMAWNHHQFRVVYPSLDNEVKVGNVYMRLWLQAGDGFIRSWNDPIRLFEMLFRRFLCEIDRNPKVTIMCVRCLERLYAIHAATIGPFTDVLVLVQSMASTSCLETQHRLLELLSTVLGVSKLGDKVSDLADIPENSEKLLNAESLSQLCEFVSWGHSEVDTIGNAMSRLCGTLAHVNSVTLEGQEEKTGATPDSFCPAVWFVASTSQLPPRREMVRGPFRVSELAQLMREGGISASDLVTTTHVTEYDPSVVAGALEDAQINTWKWKRIQNVWQLRWQLCCDHGIAIYSPSKVSLLSLKCLTRLVDSQRSHDARGVLYFPIPRAKRLLSGAGLKPEDKMISPMPVLCQALLCEDSAIVDQASELLLKLVQDNEAAMSKLYLTGLFFFACAYPGSNFLSLAKLLYATHLNQNFWSGFADTAASSDISLESRSILGGLLPEGLLHLLVNKGAEKFAEVFVGTTDSPEVIWSCDMRKTLLEMIRQHLGDFPLRLFQSNTIEYEYCPMPSIAYENLKSEFFCHNYYLEALCDTKRFPDWPIAEPFDLFHSCLERFKIQNGRNDASEGLSFTEAISTLELKSGDGSQALRKAYRTLALQFHPDKNPSGRENFYLIQSSYELLLPLVESGQSIGSILRNSNVDLKSSDVVTCGGSNQQLRIQHLLIKTQLLVCCRYESTLNNFKYPAYVVLLDYLVIPRVCMELMDTNSIALFESSVLKPDRVAVIANAIQLVYRTCLISPINSEELVIHSGVGIAAMLMRFYMHVFQQCTGNNVEGSLSFDALAIATTACRTLSGLASLSMGREAILRLPNLHVFLIAWRCCIDENVFPQQNERALDNSIVRYALDGVAHMARDPTLQQGLIGCGIVWPLLRMMLRFDQSADASDSSNQGNIINQNNPYNMRARLAVLALGVLCGKRENAHVNVPLSFCLSRLLTEPIASLLRNQHSEEILRVLNSTVQKANIVWNLSMRTQLVSYLWTIEKSRPGNDVQTVEVELETTRDFEFDHLRDEVVVGGIYLNIFVRNPNDGISEIPDLAFFLRSLVDFISKGLNTIHDHSPMWDDFPVVDASSIESVTGTTKITESTFLLALNALHVLSESDNVMCDLYVDRRYKLSPILFELISQQSIPQAYEVAHAILYSLSSKMQFADSVVKDRSLWRLLKTLLRTKSTDVEGLCKTKENYRATDTTTRIEQEWSILESLASSTCVVSQILSTSAWTQLLGILFGCKEFTKNISARLGAARTFSRFLWDPVAGQEVAALLQRFIPKPLVLKLRENPHVMLREFDEEIDTPELIWNAPMRRELRRSLEQLLDNEECHDAHVLDEFVLPSYVCVKYAVLDSEIYLGGMYLSRFIKEPTFIVKDPANFLGELLKRFVFEVENLISRELRNNLSSDETDLTIANQDVFQQVTTSLVYLCKVRKSLCASLAHLGYMGKFVSLLSNVVNAELLGAPTLTLIRVLHVATCSNVQTCSLSDTGDIEGKGGFIDVMIRAIGRDRDSLHIECALMIELLKKVFVVATEDVKHTADSESREFSSPEDVWLPSCSSGDGPTRKKVNAEDDPLSMFLTPSQAAPQVRPLIPPVQALSDRVAPYDSLSPSISSPTIIPPVGESQQVLLNSYKNISTAYAGMSSGSNLSMNPTLSYTQQSALPASNAHFWQQQQPHQPGTHHLSAQPHQVDSSPLQQSSYSNPQPLLSSPQSPPHQHAPQMFPSPECVRQYTSATPSNPAIPRMHASSASISQALHPTMPRGIPPPPLLPPPPPPPSPPSHYLSSTLYETVASVSESLEHPWILGAAASQSSRTIEHYGDSSSVSSPIITTYPPPLLPFASPRSPDIVDTRPAPDPIVAAVEIQSTLSAHDDFATRDDDNDTTISSRHGRIQLLRQALACQLCEFLVQGVLEHPTLPHVRDPNAAKVHAVDLLHLLTTTTTTTPRTRNGDTDDDSDDYGHKFSLILQHFPAWKKYK